MNISASLIAGILLALVLAGFQSMQAAAADRPLSTLEQIHARGHVSCGVSTGVPGFAYMDGSGRWRGFDVEFCRAVAAAVLGDADKLRFVPTTGKTRFAALQSGEVDLLARNTTWTFSRDVLLKMQFTGVNFYDGQGFMLRRALGVGEAAEMSGLRLCLVPGSAVELRVLDYLRRADVSFSTVPYRTASEMRLLYESAHCDVLSADRSRLAVIRSLLSRPGDHVILPDILSREPLTPLVREDDPAWRDLVHWTINAMILAEELGITSANVDRFPSDNPEANRLLGRRGNLGAQLGLRRGWAGEVLRQVGNYGEVFERHVGPDTPIGISRDLNALWNKGGLMYPFPMR